MKMPITFRAFTQCRILVGAEEAIRCGDWATLRVQAVLDVLDDCPYEGEVGLVVAKTEGCARSCDEGG